jgi:formate hydrogenlyase subunit 3/multisubunit Na+/H+ antiporter MnhD subunit
MVIDPDQQKLNNCCVRLRDGLRVFWQEYVKDWATLTLMILYLGSLAFAIVAACVSYDLKEVQIYRPV